MGLSPQNFRRGWCALQVRQHARHAPLINNIASNTDFKEGLCHQQLSQRIPAGVLIGKRVTAGICQGVPKHENA